MKRAISLPPARAGEGVHSGCGCSALAIVPARIFSRFVDAPSLRAEFPVLANAAYLNAGTDGPLPARAVTAARAELERALGEGRALAHFERRKDLGAALREAYAGLLG